MKKKLTLLILPILLSAVLCAVPHAVVGTAAEVYTVKLQDLVVAEEISCTGEVRPEKTQEVYLSGGGYPSEVTVDLGQEVCKGDMLCTIDTAVTAGILRSGSKTDADLPISEEDIAFYTRYSSYLKGSSLETDIDLSGTSKENLPVDLTQDRLTAPIDGVVTALNLQPGVFCSAHQPAAVISSAVCEKVVIRLRQEDIDHLHIGTKANISGDGLGGKSYNGILTMIYPAANRLDSVFSSETVVEAQVTVLNADRELKQGFTVNVDLYPTQSETFSILPYEAICQDQRGQEYVWTVKEGRAHRVDILCGQEFSQGTAILSGLVKTDRIILSPDGLREGQLVLIRKEG